MVILQYNQWEDKIHPESGKKLQILPERQVAEAVRIQLRGNTLNSVEVYNQCKLTRLKLDSDWERKV